MKKISIFKDEGPFTHVKAVDEDGTAIPFTKLEIKVNKDKAEAEITVQLDCIRLNLKDIETVIEAA